MKTQQNSDAPEGCAPPSCSASEVPKHRKRRGKRKWTLAYRYHGPRDLSNVAHRLMLADDDVRYHTEKAARQALSGWLAGRGVWGSLRKPPLWTCAILPPNAKPIHGEKDA